MNLHMCKRLILFSSKNLSFLHQSHFSLSFFSTSTKEQSKSTVSVYDFLLHKHQFSPEAASYVASVFTSTKIPENSDSILLFLKDCGFSQPQLEKLLKNRPRVLFTSLENTLKPKIKLFQDLGFSADDIAEIISTDPWCLYRSADNRFKPALSVLKELLGSNSELAKVLRISSWYLKFDLNKTLIANIEILKSCGVDMEQIKRHMYTFPRFLLHNPEVMKRFVQKVDEMGDYRDSRLFIHAVRVVSSMTDENWELKLQHFRDLGFSKDDISKMFRKSPSAFAVSRRKLKEVIEILLATGKYDISCIVNDPIALLCSVEKKMKPRMEVLGILDSKNLIKRWPTLATVTRMPESKFVEKLVLPYENEVGEIYMANGELNAREIRKLGSTEEPS